MFERFGGITGHCVKTPIQLAGLHIVSGEEAAHDELAAADTNDDPSAFDHARSHGDGVCLIIGRYAHFPEDFAGRCIQCSQSPVDDRCDDLVFIKGDSAIDHTAADSRLPDGLIDRRIGAPDFLMRSQIDGICDAPWSNAVEHSVEYQRCVFLMRLRISRCQRKLGRPCQSEAAHICGIDFLQRTEPLFGPIGAIGNPFIAGLASGLEQVVVHPARLLSQTNQGSQTRHDDNRQAPFPTIPHSDHSLVLQFYIGD
jgi:hypothetical protein